MTDDTVVYDAQPPQPPDVYPVTLDIEYQERLSRLSTFFRLILMIPVLLFLAIIGSWSSTDASGDAFAFALGPLGALVLAHWIVIFLRRRPANWLFDVIVHIERFTLRASAYILLLADRYPAFEGEWLLRYEVERPETLSRWKLLFWKLITAIPHFVVLIVLWFVVVVVVVIGWFAILFIGRFPRGLHGLVEGWLRWNARVTAYVLSLTDRYPPFSLT
ncbi:MAG TPA: DUF4389 domain-containing protein [Dehalococcoidia bacterium]